MFYWYNHVLYYTLDCAGMIKGIFSNLQSGNLQKVPNQLLNLTTGEQCAALSNSLIGAFNLVHFLLMVLQCSIQIILGNWKFFGYYFILCYLFHDILFYVIFSMITFDCFTFALFQILFLFTGCYSDFYIFWLSSVTWSVSHLDNWKFWMLFPLFPPPSQDWNFMITYPMIK